MSVITLDPVEYGKLHAKGKQLFDYWRAFPQYKQGNLTMHPALFEYADEHVLTAWLKNVGPKIYEDIKSENLFGVGNLGSIWFDKEYTSDSGVSHYVRVGLIAHVAAGDPKFDPEVYDPKVTFSFNIDILDLE